MFRVRLRPFSSVYGMVTPIFQCFGYVYDFSAVMGMVTPIFGVASMVTFLFWCFFMVNTFFTLRQQYQFIAIWRPTLDNFLIFIKFLLKMHDLELKERKNCTSILRLK